jgi:hypothetical protein
MGILLMLSIDILWSISVPFWWSLKFKIKKKLQKAGIALHEEERRNIPSSSSDKKENRRMSTLYFLIPQLSIYFCLNDSMRCVRKQSLNKINIHSEKKSCKIHQKILWVENPCEFWWILTKFCENQQNFGEFSQNYVKIHQNSHGFSTHKFFWWILHDFFSECINKTS